MCLDRFIKHICSMSLYISVYTVCLLKTLWVANGQIVKKKKKTLAFSAFLVQSPEPNLDETLITSLGNEKSLCMLIWVLYGQTKFETGDNCRISSMYIKNIPIKRKFAKKSEAEGFLCNCILQWLHSGWWQGYWLPYFLFSVVITVAGTYAVEGMSNGKHKLFNTFVGN